MLSVTDLCPLAAAGETTSREAFQGCQLPAARGTLGIATVGDALHKLIPATTPAPCSTKEVSQPPHDTPALLLPDHLQASLESSNAVQLLCPPGTLPAFPLQDDTPNPVPASSPFHQWWCCLTCTIGVASDHASCPLQQMLVVVTGII